MRYTYSQGHKSKAAAEDALEDMILFGDVCEGERPRVERYAVTVHGKPATRYRITLADTLMEHYA